MTATTRHMLARARTNTGSAALWISLSWDSGDPFAVRLKFPIQRREWVLGHDLLAAGMLAPAGLGDVRVCPTDIGSVEVTLQSPDGRVVVSLPADVVDAFLADIWVADPPPIPDFVHLMFAGKGATS